MAINLRKYLLGNVRFGDAEFDYDGDGGDYFLMNIKGYFFNADYFGIYFFGGKRPFEYHIDNLSLNKEMKSSLILL
jgi:uncharacterized membrane protein YjgN (DUF898 family)